MQFAVSILAIVHLLGVGEELRTNNVLAHWLLLWSRRWTHTSAFLASINISQVTYVLFLHRPFGHHVAFPEHYSGRSIPYSLRKYGYGGVLSNLFLRLPPLIRLQVGV
jgi:hypothetical protein